MIKIHVDDLAEVGVHQLHHDVQVKELLQGLLRGERVQEADDLEKNILQYVVS